MDEIDVKIVALYHKKRSQRFIGRAVNRSQAGVHKRLQKLRSAGLLDGLDRPPITQTIPPDNLQPTLRAQAHSRDLIGQSELGNKIADYLAELSPEAILVSKRMASDLRRDSARKRDDDL